MDFVSGGKNTLLLYVTVCEKVVPRLNNHDDVIVKISWKLPPPEMKSCLRPCFTVSFFETFFGLDFVLRPQITKNSNESESSLFRGENFGWKKWFRMTSSGPKKKYKRKFRLGTKRISASSEPLIGLLALLVGKIWSKNNKLIT